MYYVNDDYLCHIGNKNSGRYPKGSGEYPRAMRKGGPLHAMWLRRNKKKKQQAAPKVEKLRKPTEKQLMEIINSADAKEIYKYRQFMSTNDLTAAKNRIEAEANIKKYVDQQTQRGLDIFEKRANDWERATNSIEKFGNGYNKIAKFYNVFADENAKLPTFDKPSSSLRKAANGGDSKKQKVNKKQKAKKIPTLDGWKDDTTKDNNESQNEQAPSVKKTFNVDSVNIDKRTTVNVPPPPSNMKSRKVKTKKDGTTVETIKYRREKGQKTKPTEKRRKKKDKDNG